MQPKPPRPTGVTIIGVLGILGGLGLLALALVGGVAIEALTGLTGVAVVVGAIFGILGLLQLAVAIAFFSGKGWAWTLGIVLQVIALIINILTLPFSILGIIFNIVILYYLTRSHVKAFFGKGPVMGPVMSSGTMTSTLGSMGPAGTSSTMIRCSNCGTNASAGTTKCPSCGAAL